MKWYQQPGSKMQMGIYPRKESNLFLLGGRRKNMNIIREFQFIGGGEKETITKL